MSTITTEIIDLIANIGNIYKLTRNMKSLIPIQKTDNRAKLPEYATAHSAGLDLYACIQNGITRGYVTLEPGEFKLFGTGVRVALPEGYFADVRPRSGMALKNGITVLNSPGTIDSDYRGEIGVILINHSKTPFNVADGMRIAQLVIQKYEPVRWHEVGVLHDFDNEKTERNHGGFGSTGE